MMTIKMLNDNFPEMKPKEGFSPREGVYTLFDFPVKIRSHKLVIEIGELEFPFDTPEELGQIFLDAKIENKYSENVKNKISQTEKSGV